MEVAATVLGTKEWNNSLKTKLTLLPKKLFRMRMSRNFGMKIFFFQAEDGIRDRNVTGVQTCALPISRQRRRGERAGQRAAAGRAHRGRRAPHPRGRAPH